MKPKFSWARFNPYTFGPFIITWLTDGVATKFHFTCLLEDSRDPSTSEVSCPPSLTTTLLYASSNTEHHNHKRRNDATFFSRTAKCMTRNPEPDLSNRAPPRFGRSQQDYLLLHRAVSRKLGICGEDRQLRYIRFHVSNIQLS